MNTKSTLDILEFFSVCQQVVAYSGQIIKEVFETSGGVFKTKLEEEPFTEADVKVQTLIIKTLRTLWPEIKIIGEEEEVFEKKLDFDFNALRTDLIPKDLFKGSKGTQIELAKAIVWVDPLDGTQGFIKGELDCVTTLIGISVEGESKVGVVGKYFVKDNQGGYRWEPKCYFSHADHPHLYYIDYLNGNKLEEQKPVVKSPLSEELVICTSIHHFSADLQEKIEKIKPTEKLQIGGAGNKILSIIQGVADCYFYPKPGMKRWDICAGEAILKSVGGIVVGSDNKSITYEEAKGKSVIAEGVIATISKEKHERVMSSLIGINPSNSLLKKSAL